MPVLHLDRGGDQARLRAAVRQLAPRLLVLDPFVRLHRIENDAGEVSALLGYLRALQRQHDVVVLIVHHAHKNGSAGTQAGLSLRGSGDFHAWDDSDLYIRRPRTPCCSRSSIAPPRLPIHCAFSSSPERTSTLTSPSSPPPRPPTQLSRARSIDELAAIRGKLLVASAASLRPRCTALLARTAGEQARPLET